MNSFEQRIKSVYSDLYRKKSSSFTNLFIALLELLLILIIHALTKINIIIKFVISILTLYFIQFALRGSSLRNLLAPYSYIVKLNRSLRQFRLEFDGEKLKKLDNF